MNENMICAICQDVYKEPVTALCGAHNFCRECLAAHITSSIQRSWHPACPICRLPIQTNVTQLHVNIALRDAVAGPTQAVAPTNTTLHNPQPEEAPRVESILLPVAGPLSLRIIRHASSGNAIVRIDPPSDATALNEAKCPVLPLDVICVLDVSGSMGSDATVQDANGKTESHGLSILDVVKHATATVGAMLGPQDRLSIVSFSTGATVEMPLTAMGSAGKAALTRTLTRLDANGATNLWAGLQTAMDLAIAPGTSSERTTAILLLTDGQPTQEPPRGHLPTLERYLSQLGGDVPFSVNTVGFGYDLNSVLLRDISEKTGGMYVFIPDSGLVGTVFLNLISNVQVTAAIGMTLSVNCGAAVTRCHPLLRPTPTGAAGSIGTVQFGQPRDLLVVMEPSLSSKEGEMVQVSATLCYSYRGKRYTISANICDAVSESDISSIRDAFATQCFLQRLSSMKKENAVDALLKDLNALAPHTPLMAALSKDVSGQVSIAFEARHFHKWGRHFLPSLNCANMLQQCNNFKDFSVQMYGGALFSKLRDAGEAVFLKLPPPTPSNAFGSPAHNGAGTAVGRRANAPPVAMTSYYNVSGGCVTFDSLVAVKGGLSMAASSVVRGTVLSNGATVKCVVRIRTPRSGVTIVRFPWTGLAITAYHPIRDPHTNQWLFPLHVSGACSSLELNHDFVYTFVVEGGHSVSINEVDVVALGHGLTDNDVVEHEYLGSRRILKDLEACDGYSSGVVTVEGFTRDAKSNRVDGLIQPTSAPVAAFP